jgi:hypothetical protein
LAFFRDKIWKIFLSFNQLFDFCNFFSSNFEYVLIHNYM